MRPVPPAKACVIHNRVQATHVSIDGDRRTYLCSPCAAKLRGTAGAEHFKIEEVAG